MSFAEYELYKRVKLLGEGSYGKAFLCQCVLDGSLCVIKEVDLNSMPESEKRDTIKEAKILEALKHPNIIRFREVYKTKKGRLCIVMDYADGGDLSKKVADAKIAPLEEEQILDWFTQICLGLKHVHDRKILHRDLKSQNIFLTKSSIVKLGDFGIAKILNSTRENAKTMIGTPYYLSPEIVDNKPYSFKSDIWSLGVILYELCTSRPPFDAGSIPQLALKISKGQFSPITQNYSKELKALISLLLSVDPLKRPTVNQILKIPLITNRIRAFMSETMRKEEFSHTILHKQKIVDPDIKLSEIKQVMNDGPIPKHILEKQIQDKEKEKLKEIEKLQKQKQAEAGISEYDALKIKYSFNQPRDINPINAKAGNDLSPKLHYYDNKVEINPFIKKREQIITDFEPLNFDLWKRKDSQDSKQVLGTPGSYLPDVKLKQYVPPSGINVSYISNKDNLNAAKEPRINELPKSNIGAGLNVARPKSPINAGNEKKIIFNSKPKADKAANIFSRAPISCRNDRSEIARIGKPEARVNRSPNIFFNHDERLRKRQAKDNESSSSNVSGSKENNSDNSNTSQRKESISPQSPSLLSNQAQPQKQEQEKEAPLAKIIEAHLKKRQEGIDKLNRFKEANEKPANIFSDLHRKERETAREEERKKMKEDIDIKRKSITKAMQNEIEIEWFIPNNPMNPNYISEVDIEDQASPMHQLEETKIAQDDSQNSPDNQNLVEMISELQKIIDDASTSRILEEESNLEFIYERDNQPEINTEEEPKEFIDAAEAKICVAKSADFGNEELEFRKQRFTPILEDKIKVECITLAAQRCLSKLNELTCSVKEIDSNPFEMFENEIEGMLQGDDLKFCVPLLIIEGYLHN